MEIENFKFDPPKLPIYQLCSTFVIPVTIASVPYVLSKDEITITMCMIIALILLSVSLFAFSLSIIFKLYDSTFECQSAFLQMKILRKEVDELKDKTKV